MVGMEVIDTSMLGGWEPLMEDMDASVAEYEDEGWETFVVHPGHVNVLPEDHERSGLQILTPDNELDAISQAIEDGTSFDGYTVLRETTDGVVYFLVIHEDERDKRALFVPAFYDLNRGPDLKQHTREAGTFDLHLVPLSEEPVLTLEHEHPEQFFPTE